VTGAGAKTKKRRAAKNLARTRPLLLERRQWRVIRRTALRNAGLGLDAPVWMLGVRYHYSPNAFSLWNHGPRTEPVW
jgi:hypothetical protein